MHFLPGIKTYSTKVCLPSHRSIEVKTFILIPSRFSNKLSFPISKFFLMQWSYYRWCHLGSSDNWSIFTNLTFEHNRPISFFFQLSLIGLNKKKSSTWTQLIKTYLEEVCILLKILANLQMFFLFQTNKQLVKLNLAACLPLTGLSWWVWWRNTWTRGRLWTRSVMPEASLQYMSFFQSLSS